jgi:type IX secretion system PorP/SprF family membrane protein
MKRSALIALMAITNLGLSAQDGHFSQFYSNPLYLSPSFAGSTNGTRFVLNYRDQWPSMPGSYVTYSFSADHYFRDFNSGMGLIFFTDQAGGGKLTTTNIGYLYSYKIEVSRNRFYLQPGLSAYYYNRRVNEDKLTFADQFFEDQFVGSTTETDIRYSVQHADFAVSCLGYASNFWIGVTLDHLMKLSPTLSEDTRYSPMRLSVYGGIKYTVKKRIRTRRTDDIHLAFNLRNQNKVNQLDLGGYYLKNSIIFGLWYRGIPIGNEYNTADALIFLFGLKFKNLSMGYSYDMTVGQLIAQTGGSHEVSLVYSINNQNRYLIKRRHSAIPCPQF